MADRVKGHHPLRDHSDEYAHAKAQLRVLDVPVALVEEASAVEEEYHQHPQHSEPVDVVPSLSTVHSDLSRRVRMNRIRRTSSIRVTERA
jgi:hypothetical protein